MIALFENCSCTGETPKSPVKSLEFSSSCERIYQRIIKDINDKGYYGLKTKKEYFEIYYWYLGYEVTITLVNSLVGSKVYLRMMVYGEKKRGRTRKMLKRLIEYYKELLKDFVA